LIGHIANTTIPNGLSEGRKGKDGKKRKGTKDKGRKEGRRASKKEKSVPVRT
jgi:hypothetical protein